MYLLHKTKKSTESYGTVFVSGEIGQGLVNKKTERKKILTNQH